MVGITTILVPVRYPLTDQSIQTLEAASRLAQDHTPADLNVLHVNLYQTGDDTQVGELTRAIYATLDTVEAAVTTRHGFLVEEVILEEATQIGADIIVIGANQQATWRQILNRILHDDPAVGAFLRNNVTPETEIKEVDPATETSLAEPV